MNDRHYTGSKGVQVAENPAGEIQLFCCVNTRDPSHPRGSCGYHAPFDAPEYLASRLSQLPQLSHLQINSSGCMDRCEQGPVLVIYPQGVWYCYRSRRDVDEIITHHLMGGEVVQRLLLKPARQKPTP